MDLRMPAGMFFTAVGLILSLMGLLGAGTPAPLTQVNVNLYTGLVMLAFGGVMLWAALKARA
jgi:hypothetical protein